MRIRRLSLKRILQCGGILFLAVILAQSCVGENKNKVSVTQNAAWKWTRHAKNPVFTWESIPKKEGALYPVMGDPSLLYDEGKYKMWFGYGGLDKLPDLETLRVRTAYAESTDGMTWKIISAPALDVGGKSAWDKTNSETPSVVKDETLPDGDPRKYRMYYGGLDVAVEKLPFEEIVKKGMVYGIGLAFSSDGKTFTRLPASESPYKKEGLVLMPNTPKEGGDQWDIIHISDPHVLVKDGTYHLWNTSFSWKEKENQSYLAISYATSNDGIHWTKHGHVLKPNLPWETARKEAHLGRPYVFFRDGKYEMFYDAVKEDDNPTQNTAMGVGFATSTDGKTWTKAGDPVFVTNNGTGEKKGIIIGSGFLLKDGAYSMYYAGADPDWDHWAFNLATKK